jgi:hypothetical protein
MGSGNGRQCASDYRPDQDACGTRRSDRTAPESVAHAATLARLLAGGTLQTLLRPYVPS